LKLVIPLAPEIPVTALDEDDVRTWYDLETDLLSEEDQEDEGGIVAMNTRLQALLAEEAQLVPSNRIILAGFGQGGAMAIHAGLRCPTPLAGIMSFAGYVPIPHIYDDGDDGSSGGGIHASNAKTAVVAYHGTLDDIVPFDFAKQRYEALRAKGVSVELRDVYRMKHFMEDAPLMQMMYWMKDTVSRQS
jgi:phospholipase/carboxylesterase